MVKLDVRKRHIAMNNKRIREDSSPASEQSKQQSDPRSCEIDGKLKSG